MIAAHRRRHLWLFVFLALLMPLLLWLALSARPDRPAESELPAGTPTLADDTGPGTSR